MGRTPKLVAREEALRNAMKLFWSRGFNASTMDDIQEATGLQRGSIYSYFETKEKLFHEALDLYQKEVVQERREKVRQAKSAKAGIELFFAMIIDHSVKNRNFPGCLNTNTVTELSLTDSEIAERGRKGLKAWEKFWIEIIDQAKSEGDVSQDKDSKALAGLIIAMTQGMNVISKVNPDRNYLNQIVRAGLSSIV